MQLLKKFYGMNEGRKINIAFNENNLEIVVQPRLYAGELLDIVSSHFNLKSKEYFGICYIQEDSEQGWHWLQMDKYVLEHEFLSDRKFNPTTLHFRIKFYPKSIATLTDARIIEMLYLQCKNAFFKGEILLKDKRTQVEATALVLQTYAEFTSNQTTQSVIKAFLPVPLPPSIRWIDDSMEEICLWHQNCMGMTRGQAVINFMEIAEKSAAYGVQYYEVKDKQNVAHWLGISFRGIIQYSLEDKTKCEAIYQWKNLENLYFRDRKFSIEVHEGKRSSLSVQDNGRNMTNHKLFPNFASNVAVYNWYTRSAQLTRSLWALAVSQHQFSMDHKNHKIPSGSSVPSSAVLEELSENRFEYERPSPQKLTKSSTSRKLHLTELKDLQDMRLKLIEKKFALLQELEDKKSLLSELCDQETQLVINPTPHPLTSAASPNKSPRHSNNPSSTLNRLVRKPRPLTNFFNSNDNARSNGEDRLHLDTTFKLPENMFNNFDAEHAQFYSQNASSHNNVQEQRERSCVPVGNGEELRGLLLDYEVQSKITNAVQCLASDSTICRGVRKMRKAAYQKSCLKLKELEERIKGLENGVQIEPNYTTPKALGMKDFCAQRKNSQSAVDLCSLHLEREMATNHDEMLTQGNIAKLTAGLKRLTKPSALKFFTSNGPSLPPSHPKSNAKTSSKGEMKKCMQAARSLTDLSCKRLNKAGPLSNAHIFQHEEQEVTDLASDECQENLLTPTSLTFKINDRLPNASTSCRFDPDSNVSVLPSYADIIRPAKQGRGAFDSISVNMASAAPQTLFAQPQKSFSTSALRFNDAPALTVLPLHNAVQPFYQRESVASSLDSYVSSMDDFPTPLRNEMDMNYGMEKEVDLASRITCKGYTQGDYYNTKCSYRSRNYPTLVKYDNPFKKPSPLPEEFKTMEPQNLRRIGGDGDADFKPLAVICQDFDEFRKPLEASDYLRYSKSPYNNNNKHPTNPSSICDRVYGEARIETLKHQPEPTAYLCSTKPTERYYLLFEGSGVESLADVNLEPGFLFGENGGGEVNNKKPYLHQAASKDSGIGGSLVDVVPCNVKSNRLLINQMQQLSLS